MRPQSRPFVVEVKRSKKSPASAEAPEAPRPKVGLFDDLPRSGENSSAARRAAEALFGAVVKPAPSPVADPGDPALGSGESGPGASRRVWFAPEPTVRASEPSLAEPVSAEPVQELRRRGRPKATQVAVPLAQPSTLETPVPPVVAPLIVADEADIEVLVADTPRRGGFRLGGRRKDDLPRGERWKRRLPSVCR